MSTTPWLAGHASLERRLRALPALLRAGTAHTPTLDPALGTRARRVVLTGVGSSAAHARYLGVLLRDVCGLETRVAPLSAFLAGATVPRGDVLIVVSQGLSPNARLALAELAAWQRVIVVTAATEEGARAAGDDAKAAYVAELRRAGVVLWPFPAGENEYETLVRVVGPIAGYVAAATLVAAVADGLARAGAPVAPFALDLDAVCAALASAPERAAAALDGFDVGRLAGGVALLTAGAYGELVDNLRYKVLEGMLLPEPPVWDLLEVAHGPLQQAYTGATTLVALNRPDDGPAARDVVATIERALDPARHALVRLDAVLPGPLAVIDHEALVNELMLRWIAARGVDQIDWPGRGRDRALYELGAAPAPRSRAAVPAASALDALTWPELEGRLARERLTAVVPLGSTEQHGPHLPYATDTWIADALAERFCARVPEAVRCPALPIGCSREHLAFPGTLDVRAETFRAVLGDVLASLARHGFTCAFVFSAHGGNYAALRTALPELATACAAMRLVAYDDLDALTAAFHAMSAEFGVGAEASGHHAGELETSIMRALRPDAVRVERLAPGFVEPTSDPQALFYPSLRDRAASGVVGDPRGATAARGERYLDAWVELLVAAYRRANASQNTKGTQSA